jgi:hypothetical protein
MTSKAGTWIAGAVVVLLYMCVEIAIHEATFGPNAVRIGEVFWLITVAALGVALVVGGWFAWRDERRERSDKWLP